MSVQEALEQIEAAQKEGKTPEQLLNLIESLHASFLEGDPEERAAFEEALMTVADGLYLPHLFWMYLAGFLEDREAYRPSLEALLRTFATLPPNPLAEENLRLLLYVYFSEEEPFHLERLWHLLAQEATPEKLAYFQRVKTLTERNPLTVRIFREKFRLLGPFFPNFDHLRLPLPQVRSLIQTPSV
ncbi:MAG: hypothetical protein RQ993_01565 [Bacteroidota bacterium]|nr:hypothetical protein [Bacteroidota bacterium]